MKWAIYITIEWQKDKTSQITAGKEGAVMRVVRCKIIFIWWEEHFDKAIKTEERTINVSKILQQRPNESR